MTIQDIKNRFGIIGSAPLLDRAIDIAAQVASTDLSVLITGESGSGKEVFPQIIHTLGARKHGPYIAVNCGAIPEGTIDSELFGHEKGSFTGAHEARKGYFEVANGGTIFLDEVAEMPMATQARLLRVLESGEFIKVGSSKVQKTDVRVVAATNVNIPKAIERNKFREDLYYRLNTVPIVVPPLRERKQDIYLLMRKFAADFAAKYRMPIIKLNPEAEQVLINYYWQGNVRQLKNITEQISVIERNREIDAETLKKYLPEIPGTAVGSGFPVLLKNEQMGGNDFSERDLLYKVLFDMKRDLAELKKLVVNIIQHGGQLPDILGNDSNNYFQRIYSEVNAMPVENTTIIKAPPIHEKQPLVNHPIDIPIEESLSLEEREIELIHKALEKNKGKRKNAAKELGISERTLYRKINEYNIRKKNK
ncbi:MAG: sigma-54-dependent Fis family transcriptional regulator [Bacteroidia bacterium]|nr:sigma-54-dependent Fis family transcriptional regulator [Bacteroidia bacterium]MCZ2248627.1 sigma-54 dependent transcriptional regulator [Bacteroidia bacterium]